MPGVARYRSSEQRFQETSCLTIDVIQEDARRVSCDTEHSHKDVMWLRQLSMVDGQTSL